MRLGQTYGPLEERDLHDRDKSHLKRPSDLPEATVSRLLTSDTVTRFTFVRDPLSRFISAVANKIDASHRYSRARTALLSHLGLPETHTFQMEEVAEIFLSDPTAFNLNKHWSPQRSGLAYGVMPYTIIGRTERWDQDFDIITKAIFGAPIPRLDTRALYGHQTPKARHKTEATPRLTKLIAELYAQDYAMLQEIEQSGLFAK